MSDMMAFLILFIPLAGTTLGALLVFFMKKSGRPGGSMILTGFASGVMLAASVWSLIIPAIDMSDGRWLEALIGFSAGVLFLILTDRLSPEIPDNDEPRRKTRLLAAAVTLHNIPEGMAVGVALAGALSGNTGITFAGAFSLSLGIAIQNIPEGAIISMPLAGGMTRRKAFACGFLSGVPEPLAGALTLVLVSQITAALPYLLAFAAGAMFAVVVKELVPASVSGAHPYAGTLGAAAGFAVMMVLDVALG